MSRKKIYVCAPYSGTMEEMLHNRKVTIDRCHANRTAIPRLLRQKDRV
ncbi:MAG: hypothetical protein IJT41_11605 [Clostridia bacterium]|nr:hypothetical protein [Clostridia bacterium]